MEKQNGVCEIELDTFMQTNNNEMKERTIKTETKGNKEHNK